jgi:RNA polymerase sigma-70 factor (ECF subfamily)
VRERTSGGRHRALVGVACEVRQQRVDEGSGTIQELLDPGSAAWLRDLRDEGRQRLHALEELRELLLKAARREAARRRIPSLLGGVELEDLCQQAADDALVAVTSKLDTFRGASRFTTWAYKFAVFEISVKLRRHEWVGRTIPMAYDDPTWDRFGAVGIQTGDQLEAVDLLGAVRRAVVDELTPRQRDVFVAAVLNDIPIDALAERLGATRGAVYKVLHDARRILRRRLERDGYLGPVGER